MPNSVTGSNEPTAISYKILQSIYKNGTPQPFIKPNGIVDMKIDVKNLLDNKIETISINGEKFYYIKGSEPSLYKISGETPSIINVRTQLNNGNVYIDYDVKNTDDIEIFRIFNDKIEKIYSGKPQSVFIDKLKNFGKYYYKIVLSNNIGTTTYKTPIVKYDKTNLSIIEGDKWLFD